MGRTGSQDANLTTVHRNGKIYKVGKKSYPSGDTYDGEFLHGARDGQGVLNYANGDKYTGDFTSNYFHGQGAFESADYKAASLKKQARHAGSRYEGGYLNGRKHGSGVQHAGDGSVFDGFFENDVYHGRGTLLQSNGDVVKAAWIAGHIVGKAKITFSNGDSFEGSMEASMFQGQGRFVDNLGGSYEGQFQRHLKHGNGTRIYSNGTRYVGTFVRGKCQGEGMKHYANGDTYVGIWEDDEPTGRGVMILAAKGDKYEGEFFRGQYCGRGRYTWSDGGFYEGDYKDPGRKAHSASTGLRNGRGIRKWASGAVYEGGWLADEMSGEGLLTTSAEEYKGEFRRGVKHGVGEMRSGNALGMWYTCGLGFRHRGRGGYCVHRGNYANGHYDGEGHFLCVDGKEYRGAFKKGQRHGRGNMLLCGVADRGDPSRRHVGGLNSLYRPLSYDGEWVEDERTGQGVQTSNDGGQKLAGEWDRGVLNGVATCTYSDGLSRRGLYRRGYRLKWLDPDDGALLRLVFNLGDDEASMNSLRLHHRRPPALDPPAASPDDDHTVVSVLSTTSTKQ